MRHAAGQIDDQAARWAVRLDAGPLSADEQRELDAWLGTDPRCRGAFVRAQAMWTDVDRIAALSAPEERTISVQPQLPVARVRSVRPWLLAAGVSAVAIAAAAIWPALNAGTSYWTAVGEVRRIALADGSILSLNTNSKAVIRFNGQRRSVQLARGEALFEVTRDPARPFRVTAQGVTITALGTAFAVRENKAGVNITVTEGLVEVVQDTPAGNKQTARRVVANYRVVIPRAQSAVIEPIEPKTADRQLAWRGGMVAFDGERLADAIVEVNRHSTRRIVVDTPELADKPVVGIFKASDSEAFARTAAVALRAEVIEEGDTLYLR